MKKEKKPYHSIRKPSILGGKGAFQKFLADNLAYPKEALDNKIGGIAHVKCEISDKGSVLKAESIHKLGYGLDKEAERLCLLIKFENTVERGLKIKHTHSIRIPFVLPKQEAVQPNLQINYQTTTAAPKKEEEKKSYSYTIKF